MRQFDDLSAGSGLRYRDQPWWRAWLTRVIAVVSSVVLSLGAIWMSFQIPLKEPNSAGYDPSSTWQARTSLALILLSLVAVVIAFVATVRTNAQREAEHGYSAYGALVVLALPILLVFAAWLSRAVYVQ